ncbi:hypothetical protein Ari01nite_81330 [Paractinoplanes rishiriensis]|uniref:Uncharacterized protein n=1 Tax=Paractinoplanes rishiriensis TaxID=1050105 RepID=A0A919K8Y0_9ACTN|nr:hypothetical protein Ari01nite_81330 [Actinoplanes rishiriensis]
MIVARSAGGVVGPLLTAALYEANGQDYTVLAAVALALPLITRMPDRR